MAAPRLNFFAANFSYAPLLTKANFMDALTKFLVSGFDPWNIERIEVTNKVARVTTTEKNFYSLPGCKLAIAGTNRPALDDSHAIKEVFKDGFSFDIDTPDGDFTDGLTYSVPSLGWSLVKQTTVQTIYKSGTAAAVPFYVVITRRSIGPFIDSRYDYHFIQICYELDESTNEPVLPYPGGMQIFQQVMPIHPYTLSFTPNNYNVNMNWYFYGDGASFVVAADASTSYTANTIRDGAQGGMSSSYVGEGKAPGSRIPVHTICGTKLSTSEIYSNWRAIAWNAGNNTSPALCGYTSSSTFTDAIHGVRAPGRGANTGEGGVSFPKRYQQQWSGNPINRVSPFFGNYDETCFMPMELWDNVGQRLGWAAGIYALDNRPIGIEVVPHRSFVLNVSNRPRTGVLVRSSSTVSTASGGSSSPADKDAVTWLDLTGPLR